MLTWLFLFLSSLKTKVFPSIFTSPMLLSWESLPKLCTSMWVIPKSTIRIAQLSVLPHFLSPFSLLLPHHLSRPLNVSLNSNLTSLLHSYCAVKLVKTTWIDESKWAVTGGKALSHWTLFPLLKNLTNDKNEHFILLYLRCGGTERLPLKS